jgi:hypothetical protein
MPNPDPDAPPPPMAATSFLDTDVDRGFDFGLSTALFVNGKNRDFCFSDGNTENGRIPKRIKCLIINQKFLDLHTHARRLNTVVHNEAILCVFRQSDVPYGAALYSNAYLDVGGVSYRIEAVTLKAAIYTLTLMVLGTN